MISAIRPLTSTLRACANLVIVAGLCLAFCAGASAQVPIVFSGGIVNGASFAAGKPVAAGSIVSIFGTNLASSIASAPTPPVGAPLVLPTTLGGASVRVGSTIAPLFFVSPGQINFQMPFELSGQTGANLIVSVGGVASGVQGVQLSDQAPGIFSAPGKLGAVLNSDNTSSQPAGTFAGSGVTARAAFQGEVIQIFCTGLGKVNNFAVSGVGTPLPDNTDLTKANTSTPTLPTVTIGGIQAAVSYSGLAAGFVGLYQVNATVPATATVGNTVPVVITFGGNTSDAVNIAVQASPIPTLTSISPTATTAGAAGFTLIVTGTNFASSSVVQWNGQARATTYVSATQLTASIPGSDLATATTTPVSVTVSNLGAGGSSSSLPFTINAKPSVTTTTLPGGVAGVFYSQQLAATNGTGTLTWTLKSGSLPSGLALSSAGVISGSPSATGTSTFTVTVTDGVSVSADSQPLSIAITQSSLAISTVSVPGGTVGAVYPNPATPTAGTLQATGGSAPYTWSVTGGALPTGLNLASSGAITGTPMTAGAFSFTVTVRDINGVTVNQSLSITIATTPTVTTATLPNATVGLAYNQTLAASNGTVAAPAGYTWAISSGALPAGLGLTATTGVISGVPTVTGATNFSVTATDTAGATSAAAPLSITVIAGVAIATTSLPNGTATAQYPLTGATLTATGGIGPYSWALTSGSLPPGLTLATNGVISGTPTTAGTSTFTVTVTDTQRLTKSAQFTITINQTLAVTSPGILSDGTVGTPYGPNGAGVQLTATGGTTPYTWAIASGSLPPGLTLSKTGLISGTPTQSSPQGNGSKFTVSVTDSNGIIATSQTLLITIH